MKEIIKFDCPAGKSIIEALATQLFKKMTDNNQTIASATYKYKDEELSATLKMTIEINF